MRPWLVIVVLVSCLTPIRGAAPAPPNIVIVLADDMGFSDLGCYGGEIATPQLDALAAGGLRFTQFYNTARCCPTRASLLTGLYPHQAGIGHMVEDRGLPAYRGDLNEQCRTIAQMLQPAGYRNYAVGKWHVSRNVKQDGPNHNWPLQRGFDRFYGMVSGGGSFFDPFTLCRDNTRISAYADPDYQPKTYYFTDAISDHAVQFVNDHQKNHRQQPFLMYVAYTAAHWPMHALPEDMAKYRGRYDVGYEPIRKARFEKSAKLGLIDAGQGLSPAGLKWEEVENKAREAACMEVYAAMVDRMDQGIGRIVAAMKANGQLENTLFLYLQDNGGCAEPMGRGVVKGRVDGPRAASPTLPPMPATAMSPSLVPSQTRDGYPVRQGPNVFPGPADTYVGYGEGWANVSNTPFREYKHWVHEGGISTPLIAHWPRGIAARGEIRHQPGHLIDIAATCVELAQAKYPHNATPLEGQSLRPAFENKNPARHALFWEHEGNKALRQGDWKLVAKHNQAWELYNVAKDRVEMKNCAGEEAQRVRAMSAEWEAIAKRQGVAEWPVKSDAKPTPKEKGKQPGPSLP
jgi:arylsulfatase A-like enzyme